MQIQNIKETDRLSTEANRLKDMLRRLCRKLGILRKELTCWKDDVLGRVKRQHNEDEMLMNDLCRHFRQWQTRIDADKDDIGRKAREEANCTVAHELRQIKANQ